MSPQSAAGSGGAHSPGPSAALALVASYIVFFQVAINTTAINSVI